jgi:hypothetical protein
MNFDVRFMVRDGYDDDDYYCYHYYFILLAVNIHEKSINNLKMLKWIFIVLTEKVVNQFEMTHNRPLSI